MTIEKIIATFAPDHLLIEPSGIASPSGVLDALDQLGVTPVTVIGIADVTEFIDLYEAEIYGSFFQEQVANSDVVLINKTDLEGEDKIKRTIMLVEEINPNAIIFRTVRAALAGPVPDAPTGKRTIQRHGPHLRFDSGSFSLGRSIEFSSFKRLFEDIKKGIYGNIVRAKSLVITDNGPFRFDLSYGTIDVFPIASTSLDSRLVVIGERIEKEALSRALNSFY
jgi:G3E family GTPase